MLQPLNYKNSQKIGQQKDTSGKKAESSLIQFTQQKQMEEVHCLSQVNEKGGGAIPCRGNRKSPYTVVRG